MPGCGCRGGSADDYVDGRRTGSDCLQRRDRRRGRRARRRTGDDPSGRGRARGRRRAGRADPARAVRLDPARGRHRPQRVHRRRSWRRAPPLCKRRRRDAHALDRRRVQPRLRPPRLGSRVLRHRPYPGAELGGYRRAVVQLLGRDPAPGRRSRARLRDRDVSPDANCARTRTPRSRGELQVGATRVRPQAATPVGGAVGSCTVTRSPPDCRGVRVSVPPCAWVMLWTIARPRPTPAWSVRMRLVPR